MRLRLCIVAFILLFSLEAQAVSGQSETSYSLERNIDYEDFRVRKESTKLALIKDEYVRYIKVVDKFFSLASGRSIKAVIRNLKVQNPALSEVVEQELSRSIEETSPEGRLVFFKMAEKRIEKYCTDKTISCAGWRNVFLEKEQEVPRRLQITFKERKRKRDDAFLPDTHAWLANFSLCKKINTGNILRDDGPVGLPKPLWHILSRFDKLILISMGGISVATLFYQIYILIMTNK